MQAGTGASLGEETAWPAALWGIVGLGLLLRIVWAVLIPVDPVSDGVAYHTFATNIVTHGVYGWNAEEPAAYWPVGTSAILAFLYLLFGVNFLPVVVLNIAVSVGVILQVFWLARHYFDVRAGLLAAAIIAVWPSLIMYTSVIASEVIFIFLLLGGLIAHEARWRNFWVGVLATGLLWAAAAYVRPLALLVPIVFGASALFRGQIGLVRAAIRLVLIFVIMGAAIAPWSARNTEVFGERVLISTNFGPVFWMGNNPDTNGGYQRTPPWAGELNEIQRSNRLKEEAFAYVAAEPGAFVLRTLAKFVRLHERETIAVAWNARQIKARAGTLGESALKGLATLYWLVVLALALGGCWALLRGRGLWQLMIHPCFLGWMYITWVHAVIIQGDRYHIPAIPFIAILAACALQYFRNRTTTKAVPA